MLEVEFNQQINYAYTSNQQIIGIDLEVRSGHFLL